MLFQARTYGVLIVSASEKFNTVTASLLPPTDYWPVTVVKSVGEARRRLADSAWDIVIINAPLPDDFGLQLAADACADTEAGVLLLVKNDLYEEVWCEAVENGIATLSKPTNAQAMGQALRLLRATRERLRKREERQLSVEEKIEEMRLVNRAKWQLISCLGMTEPEAHQYISRQAMDKRVTRREAAMDILRTYNSE